MIIAGYTYVTHKLISRPWGPECRYTFRRPDGTLIDDTVDVGSMDISDADLIDKVTARLAQLKVISDFRALLCHDFDDAGPEIKEALRWLVVKIRANPNATLTQATTTWNAEWANSLFSFANLVTYFQNRLQGVTWAQFKTYVIDHKFEGVD